MGEPITPEHIESEIMRLSRLLDHATEEIAKRARAAAEARSEYKLEEAKAIVKQVPDEGRAPAADVRKAAALVGVGELYRKAEYAEAVQLAAQEAARNTRSQLEALRSVMANVRHLIGVM